MSNWAKFVSELFDFKSLDFTMTVRSMCFVKSDDADVPVRLLKSTLFVIHDLERFHTVLHAKCRQICVLPFRGKMCQFQIENNIAHKNTCHSILILVS